MSSIWQRSIFCYVLFLFSSLGVAEPLAKGLSLSQTRIILHESEGSATVSIRNKSDKPWLIRSHVTMTPGGDVAAPFILTPPLFRLDAQGQHAVRVIRQGASSMPQDRESVFYVSMLAIPSASTQNGDNESGVNARVMVGIDSVVKLFYRPAQLKERVTDAARKLKFVQRENNLLVINSTEYHITLASLKINGTDIHFRDYNTSMIPPFSESEYPIQHKVESVSWTVINDFGGSSQVYNALAQQE